MKDATKWIIGWLISGSVMVSNAFMVTQCERHRVTENSKIMQWTDRAVIPSLDEFELRKKIKEAVEIKKEEIRNGIFGDKTTYNFEDGKKETPSP